MLRSRWQTLARRSSSSCSLALKGSCRDDRRWPSRPVHGHAGDESTAQHITLALEGADPHFEIQLLEFDPTPGTDPGAHPTNLRQRGFNHLAFRVDDIEAATAHLVANGVTMLSDEMDYISRDLRLFEGPEGITLELVQWGGSDASG
jgi:catechol 2,3-dioxygenase-like lactoylglutathione lyase family enzyme